MEKEIINLELSPKVGMFKCLVEGISQCFENFIPFCKTLLPVLLMFLSTILLTVILTLSVFALYYKNVLMSGIFCTFLILAFIIFSYTFWKYLLGLIAVSYLAKDIYENKPIQTTKDYYSYIEAHSKNYVKYLLIVALIVIVWFLIFFSLIIFGSIFVSGANVGVKILCSILLALFILLSFPFGIGLFLSQFFFAFQDKTKPFLLIKKSFCVTFKKFFPILGFIILLQIPIYILSFIPVINLLISIVSAYFIPFVITRYYFELIKD